MRIRADKKVVFVLIFSLFCVMLSSGAAMAKAEYKWKFGVPWPRPTQNEYFEMFCDRVNEYSNGRIEMKFYPNGQLGSHDEHFHSVQAGSVEVAMVVPYINLVPGGAVNWIPWTIENVDEAKLAFDAEEGLLWKVMEDAYNEVGMHMLFQTSFGAYGVGNTKRPIRKPEDFKNLKIRVSSSLGMVRAIENIGKGHGVMLQTIPWGDVYDALAKGVVDGSWSLWPSLVEDRHCEVLNYYTDLNFAWDINNIVVNKEVWDELPQDLKDAVFKAAREVETMLYDRQEEMEAKFKQQLSEVEGFEIVELTPEERAVFRERSNTPEIWEELVRPWVDKKYPGENMTQKLQDELQRIHEVVLEQKADQ